MEAQYTPHIALRSTALLDTLFEMVNIQQHGRKHLSRLRAVCFTEIY